MIRLCISGSRGKMGSRILELAKEDGGFEVTGAFDIDGDAEANIKGCDCLIEFTAPKATIEHLALCERFEKPIVIGTTGLSDSDREKIKKASETIAVVFSPNMSIGVNLMFGMAGDAARILGPEYNVEIIEAHHVHKKDSPSGTARELARIVKAARKDAEVPIESVREDEIVGEHTITFDGPLDTIEITHSAKTRDIFANGALTAAKFAAGKKTGLFSMKDVLRPG
jgi:4-hydroxy-tetrahydrodipicolinate reductase